MVDLTNDSSNISNEIIIICKTKLTRLY